MVDHRKPKLAEIMDNIIFDWVEEIPRSKQGRGKHGGTSFKYEALCDLMKSKPEHIIRLEMFFDMKIKYLANNFHKYIKTYHPEEMKNYDYAIRKEGVDATGESIYVFYASYYEEVDENGEE